jgi:hypothetical protein
VDLGSLKSSKTGGWPFTGGCENFGDGSEVHLQDRSTRSRGVSTGCGELGEQIGDGGLHQDESFGEAVDFIRRFDLFTLVSPGDIESFDDRDLQFQRFVLDIIVETVGCEQVLVELTSGFEGWMFPDGATAGSQEFGQLGLDEVHSLLEKGSVDYGGTFQLVERRLKDVFTGESVEVCRGDDPVGVCDLPVEILTEGTDFR